MHAAAVFPATGSGVCLSDGIGEGKCKGDGKYGDEDYDGAARQNQSITGSL
jgi:hypothetical protein